MEDKVNTFLICRSKYYDYDDYIDAINNVVSNLVRNEYDVSIENYTITDYKPEGLSDGVIIKYCEKKDRFYNNVGSSTNPSGPSNPKVDVGATIKESIRHNGQDDVGCIKHGHIDYINLPYFTKS